jgi:hypothetical protein
VRAIAVTPTTAGGRDTGCGTPTGMRSGLTAGRVIVTATIQMRTTKMSIPIKYCFLVEAVDKPESFRKLHPTMKRNLEGGHFTMIPCDHNPPCRELTRAEQVDLFQRFKQSPAS